MRDGRKRLVANANTLTQPPATIASDSWRKHGPAGIDHRMLWTHATSEVAPMVSAGSPVVATTQGLADRSGCALLADCPPVA